MVIEIELYRCPNGLYLPMFGVQSLSSDGDFPLTCKRIVSMHVRKFEHLCSVCRIPFKRHNKPGRCHSVTNPQVTANLGTKPTCVTFDLLIHSYLAIPGTSHAAALQPSSQPTLLACFLPRLKTTTINTTTLPASYRPEKHFLQASRSLSEPLFTCTASTTGCPRCKSPQRSK